MTEQDPFDDLQRRLRAGEEDAIGEVFRCFAQRLVALARSRLDRRLRQKVDPEDVVQSAFRSFFLRCADGQFDFASPDHLWGLLVLVTLRKCRRQVERFKAARRDVRRETALEPAAGSAGNEEAVLTREPTPEEAALLGETVENVMVRLDSPLKRRVFELSLQGYTIPEIGAALGYYERGVLRTRSEVRAILQELSAG